MGYENLRKNFEQALVTAKRPYLKGFLVKLFLRKKFLFCRALQKARTFLANFFQLWKKLNKHHKKTKRAPKNNNYVILRDSENVSVI